MRIAITLLCTCAALFAQPAPRAPHPQILATVNQINADSIHSYIGRLDSFYTRHTYSDTTSDTVGIGAAIRWVEAKARSYDRLDRYSFEHYPWVQFWQGQNVTRHILICRVPGNAVQDRARYIIGGHLDSRTVNGSDLGRAPGADDNASSCAALLELLRVLPDTIENDLEVIWFTGEEQGLWGSEAYATHLADMNVRVDAMIAMDMISHITTNTGAVDSISCRLYAQGLASQGGTASVSRNWQRSFRWITDDYVPDFEMVIFPATDRPGRGSDHISFSEAGFAALRVIERNEDLAYQHSANDLTQFTTPSYARKVAAVTMGGLIDVLRAPSRPGSPAIEGVDGGLLFTIADSVSLPEGGAFYLAIREQGAADFDSILALDTLRFGLFYWGQHGTEYGFSIARSNSAGYISPFSRETLADFFLSSDDSRPAIVSTTTMDASPNPFNDEIRFEIDLAQAGEARLAIYDVLGRQVTELVNEPRTAGPMTMFWEAHDFATGIYFVRLETRTGSLTQKIMLLK